MDPSQALEDRRTRRRLAELRRDPLAFGEALWGHAGPRDPALGGSIFTPDQREVLRLVRDHPRVAVPSGHSCGKTYLAAVVFWWLFSSRVSKVLTTAPTERQVDDLLWSEIRKLHRTARVPLGCEPFPRKSRIHVSEEHFALGLATTEPERIQGYHGSDVLIVLDEAGGIAPPIWDAVEFVASGGDVRILAIGNPPGSTGPFRQACESSLWRTHNMDCHNHPNVLEGRTVIPGAVAPSWPAERAAEWGEDSPIYQMRVRGRFPDEDTDALISLHWVLESQRREPVPDPDQSPIVAVDVARWGDAETVILALDGPGRGRMTCYRHRDLMRTVGEVMRVVQGYGPGVPVRVVVDDDGLGGGVTDRLLEQGVHVIPFRGGDPPANPVQFRNLRAEAWWGLREALREGQIYLPQDDTLKSQLTSLQYGVHSGGQIELEKKEELERRGLPSPDRGDAWAMAWWARGVRSQRAGRKRRRSGERNWRSRYADITGVK